CGFVFDPELVADVVGMPSIPALRAFGRIEHAHRLVRSTGRDFAFDHHQVQEALYHGQPLRLREQYHAAIGEALERREEAAECDPTELGGTLTIALCTHFLDGGVGTKAVRYLDAALTHFEDGYLNEEGIALAERALSVPGLLTGRDRVGVLLRKAKRHDFLRQHDKQQAAYDEALELADADGDPFLRSDVRLPYGLFLHRTQAGGAGIPYFKEALEFAREAGDRRNEARALGNMALALRGLDRVDESEEYNLRSLEIYREIGHRRGEAVCLGNLGGLYSDFGLFDKAMAYYQQCLEIFQELRNRQQEVIVTHNLGTCYRDLGQARKSQACFERCISISQDIGFGLGEEVTRDNLFELRAWMGHLEEANVHFEARLAADREAGARHREATSLLTLGEVAMKAGDLAQAERRLRPACSLFRELDMSRRIAESAAALGGVLVETGRGEEAAPLLEEAIALAREGKNPATEVRAACFRALLPAGDAMTARRLLEAQVDHIDRETAIEGYYLLWKATGDPALLETAKRLFDEVVAHACEDDRPSIVANIPLHAEIRRAVVS
ncbi:MAG: tetratricopeptide repeat protein, partial [Planctomycetota bacterium]